MATVGLTGLKDRISSLFSPIQFNFSNFNLSVWSDRHVSRELKRKFWFSLILFLHIITKGSQFVQLITSSRRVSLKEPTNQPASQLQLTCSTDLTAWQVRLYYIDWPYLLQDLFASLLHWLGLDFLMDSLVFCTHILF